MFEKNNIFKKGDISEYSEGSYYYHKNHSQWVLSDEILVTSIFREEL